MIFAPHPIRFLMYVLISLFMILGCGSAMDPLTHPRYTYNSTALSQEDAQLAIRRGIMSAGWSIVQETRGQTIASVNSGGHFAKVAVDYNHVQYIINLVEASEGLRYDGIHIHKRYTFWVNRLNRHLKKEFYAVVAGKHQQDMATSQEAAVPEKHEQDTATSWEHDTTASSTDTETVSSEVDSETSVE